jgi:hypothetical protein
VGATTLGRGEGLFLYFALIARCICGGLHFVSDCVYSRKICLKCFGRGENNKSVEFFVMRESSVQTLTLEYADNTSSMRYFLQARFVDNA